MSSQKSTLLSVLQFSHQLAKARLSKGDCAIDATLGNGHDTLMLAQQVGDQGCVLAFDVQTQAFEKSRLLLEKHNALTPVHFIRDSHAHMKEQWQSLASSCAPLPLVQLGQEGDVAYSIDLRLGGTIANHVSTGLSVPILSLPKIIMFNLGYLPGADKRYTTQVKSTLEALEQSLQLLLPQGLVLLTVYPGHPEGQLEDQAISQWVSTLSQKKYQVLRYGFVNQIHSPPYLLVIEKLPC